MYSYPIFTLCQILTGDNTFIFHGRSAARQGDLVTCGKHSGTYNILGGSMSESLIGIGLVITGIFKLLLKTLLTVDGGFGVAISCFCSASTKDLTLAGLNTGQQ